MPLTRRQLNRSTLARQLLLARERMPVVDAVGRLLALQAQEPASPYVALWNRLIDFDHAELDAAYRSFDVVKATLMRATLHAVVADDRTAFHAAMRPFLRDVVSLDARLEATGLSSDEAEAMVASMVAFAHLPRSRSDFEAHVAEHVGAASDPGLWRALRATAPMVHAPTADAWSFGRAPLFVAPPALAEPVDPVAATERLVRRYLAAFGPATRKDAAQFARLRIAEIGPAFVALADELVTLEGPDGETLYDLPGAVVPDEDVPAPPRLLAMWDSVLLAYADRSRVIPPAYRPHVIRRNGDVLPTVLVDGHVAGVWRIVEDAVEVTAFHALPDAVWAGIEEEARALLPILTARDAAVYRRFGHWWARLTADPSATHVHRVAAS